jgi:hypothetical protein
MKHSKKAIVFNVGDFLSQDRRSVA